MARLFLHIRSGSTNTVASAVKTILQVQAAANDRIACLGWGVSFQGTSATDPPVFVELLRQTTAGTGLDGSPVIAQKYIDTGITVQTTALAGHQANTANTAEPTSGDLLDAQYIHPQAGVRYFYPLGQEQIIENTQRLAIRVTDGSASHLCEVDMDLEE